MSSSSRGCGTYIGRKPFLVWYCILSPSLSLIRSLVLEQFEQVLVQHGIFLSSCAYCESLTTVELENFANIHSVAKAPCIPTTPNHKVKVYCCLFAVIRKRTTLSNFTNASSYLTAVRKDVPHSDKLYLSCQLASLHASYLRRPDRSVSRL